MKRDHIWIEVGNRRWCLGCESFQMRATMHREWRGLAFTYCPRNTPYAQKEDTNGRPDDRTTQEDAG